MRRSIRVSVQRGSKTRTQILHVVGEADADAVLVGEGRIGDADGADRLLPVSESKVRLVKRLQSPYSYCHSNTTAQYG